MEAWAGTSVRKNPNSNMSNEYFTLQNLEYESGQSKASFDYCNSNNIFERKNRTRINGNTIVEQTSLFSFYY